MRSASSAPTIVVVGGINMDLVSVSSRMPQQGETILGERFFTSPGGKGANQAVAAARLGAHVRMVGRVGDDAFGPVLLSNMEDEGIDVSGVMRDAESSSGIAVILLETGGNNRIIVIPGANANCDELQVEAARHAIDGADAVMLQNEISIEISIAAARYARDKGVTVVWDPAPAEALPDKVYKLANVLTPNQVEAEMMTGVVVTSPEDASRAAEALLNRGVEATVVKLGGLGAYYSSAAGAGLIHPYPVEVVDTVAAGDAFGAGLTIALAEGKPLADAVRFGAAAGALAVTKQGAQYAMPTRQQLDDFLTHRATPDG